MPTWWCCRATSWPCPTRRFARRTCATPSSAARCGTGAEAGGVGPARRQDKPPGSARADLGAAIAVAVRRLLRRRHLAAVEIEELRRCAVEALVERSSRIARHGTETRPRRLRLADFLRHRPPLAFLAGAAADGVRG